jgi:hypothetical protein
MSASSHAQLVLGYRFTEDELAFSERRRSCGHPEIETAKFCPECGKPMYTEKRTRLIFGGDKVGQFECFRGNSTTNGYSRYEPDYYIVGVPLESPLLPETVNIDEVTQIRLDIAAEIIKVEPRTKIDISTFGYHVVHYFG